MTPFGSTGFHQRYTQEDIFKGFDFGDIFKEFGFGGSQFFTGRKGGPRFSFGSGAPFGSYTQQPQRKGTDIVYEITLSMKEITTGTQKTITLKHQGQSENITVKIPKGMVSGKKLRLTGKGNPSPSGGPSGDLFIQAKVLEDPVFRAEGHDLYVDREIKLSEALIGTSILIPSIHSKEFSLKIPPGTKHKTKFRLSGHGLPHMKGHANGDLFVNIQVNIPNHLTKEQKKTR